MPARRRDASLQTGSAAALERTSARVRLTVGALLARISPWRVPQRRAAPDGGPADDTVATSAARAAPDGEGWRDALREYLPASDRPSAGTGCRRRPHSPRPAVRASRADPAQPVPLERPGLQGREGHSRRTCARTTASASARSRARSAAGRGRASPGRTSRTWSTGSTWTPTSTDGSASSARCTWRSGRPRPGATRTGSTSTTSPTRCSGPCSTRPRHSGSSSSVRAPAPTSAGRSRPR